MLKNSILNRLEEIFGDDDVLARSKALEVYSIDSSPFLGDALAVVRPENPEEISELIKLAEEHSLKITPRGSGSGTSGGAVPENSIVVDMKKMDRIEVFEDDMIVYAEAGAILYDIKKELEKHDLFIPPEPGSVRIATAGGFVANNGGGKRGAKYGSIRNFISGINAVLPNGEIITVDSRIHRAPGVIPSVFAGSEGKLGIITGIYFRALPMPEKRVTAIIELDSLKDLNKKVRIIMKHMPDSIEFVDSKSSELLGFGDNAFLAVEFFSKAPVEIKGELLEGKEEREFWEKRELLGVEIAKRGTRLYSAEDFSVPFSKLGQFIEQIYRLESNYNAEVFVYGHLDTANIHPAIVSDDYNSAIKLSDEIYKTAKSFGATVGEHGFGKRWNDERSYFLEWLRSCMDPKRIMC